MRPVIHRSFIPGVVVLTPGCVINTVLSVVLCVIVHELRQITDVFDYAEAWFSVFSNGWAVIMAMCLQNQYTARKERARGKAMLRKDIETLKPKQGAEDLADAIIVDIIYSHVLNETLYDAIPQQDRRRVLSDARQLFNSYHDEEEILLESFLNWLTGLTVFLAYLNSSSADTSNFMWLPLTVGSALPMWYTVGLIQTWAKM